VIEALLIREQREAPIYESHLRQLRERIEDRSAVVAVVGLGYVGLPLAAEFHSAGFRVIGFDTDEEKIEMLS